MCIITNTEHIVVSVSLIPGLSNIPESFHCYFPVKGLIPKEGDYYLPSQNF